MRLNLMFNLILVMLLSGFLFAQEEPVNFSGEWKLNQEKSETGSNSRRGFGGLSKLVVKQGENLLTIERTGQNRNGGEMTHTMNLTMDGKATKTEGFRGSEQTTAAEWADNGNFLTLNSVVVFSRNGSEFEISSVEVWRLGEDEKTLIIESTRTTPRGERKSKLVFDKIS